MKKLYTFESFVPRNIEKRQQDLLKMQEKDVLETEKVEKELGQRLIEIRGKKVTDKKEQFFLDQFKDCVVKIDTEEYPNEVFFFNVNGKYIARYDWKNAEFWIRDEDFWSVLESKYRLKHNKVRDLTQAWVEEHFKLGPVTTCEISPNPVNWVEEHFKLGPVTTEFR